MRKQLTVLVAATIAFVALLPLSAAAQDQAIPRRQPISCLSDKPYPYYQTSVDSTHAVVGWYCTATQPVVFNGASLTATAAELNTNAAVVAGTVTASKTVVAGANKNLDTLAVTTPVIGSTATLGSATQERALVLKKTAIADNTATDVITVTVPNGNHAAAIRLTFVSSNGSTDAFESSRSAIGLVVLARTTGVATVASAIALTNTGIATVAAGSTHTLAYAVTAMVGAVGATQTFTITVTIDDSGNLGSNQVVVFAEVINTEATGVTIAAS